MTTLAGNNGITNLTTLQLQRFPVLKSLFLQACVAINAGRNVTVDSEMISRGQPGCRTLHA